MEASDNEETATGVQIGVNSDDETSCAGGERHGAIKLNGQLHDHRQISASPPIIDERATMLLEVSEQGHILLSTVTWNEADRAVAKFPVHALANLAKNKVVVVPFLVLDGGAPPSVLDNAGQMKSSQVGSFLARSQVVMAAQPVAAVRETSRGFV